jgi:hypothetical protein
MNCRDRIQVPLQSFQAAFRHHASLSRDTGHPTLAPDEEHGDALNAVLMDDSQMASAEIMDLEAEKAVQRKRRMVTILASFFLASVVAAVAVLVGLTRKDAPISTIVIVPPTASPVPSLTPSDSPTPYPTTTPSVSPSTSPSTTLFGFLVANSFDDGVALSISGSSQQRAMEWWLNHKNAIYDNALAFNANANYLPLQYYSLVTLYYETFGDQWLTGTSGVGAWLSESAIWFCGWTGVTCNDQLEIVSLQLSGNRLFGSIPGEVAILDKSLSKSRNELRFTMILCVMMTSQFCFCWSSRKLCLEQKYYYRNSFELGSNVQFR